MAKNLGINFIEVPIKSMVDEIDTTFKPLFNNIQKKWDFRYKKSFTMDNIQARSRAIILWGIANEFEACIPIATSDKSELYMGYATINGDMSGGFAPIADVPKTKLFALARFLNENRKEKNAIPIEIINKKPGGRTSN
ncbi:MAG: NAD(+) synthase [Candidatus Melainabacteria bacterium]|nr:MAG: NAD(+) synthase [Candidatus Melainabacteria bacterium]